MRASPMGPSLKMVEREGCPINGCSLPGVSAHDAGASSWRHVWCERSIGIWIGLHPAWLALCDGLTPLLLHDFKKRSKSKAVFRASMK